MDEERFWRRQFLLFLFTALIFLIGFVSHHRRDLTRFFLDPPAAEPGCKVIDMRSIEINKASAEELASLPGIGPVLAQRIIEYRQRNGCFGCLDDLKRVNGIGPKKAEAIEPYIFFSGENAVSPEEEGDQEVTGWEKRP